MCKKCDSCKHNCDGCENSTEKKSSMLGLLVNIGMLIVLVCLILSILK